MPMHKGPISLSSQVEVGQHTGNGILPCSYTALFQRMGHQHNRKVTCAKCWQCIQVGAVAAQPNCHTTSATARHVAGLSACCNLPGSGRSGQERRGARRPRRLRCPPCADACGVPSSQAAQKTAQGQVGSIAITLVSDGSKCWCRSRARISNQAAPHTSNCQSQHAHA
jgi:hypothetical protein